MLHIYQVCTPRFHGRREVNIFARRRPHSWDIHPFHAYSVL